MTRAKLTDEDVEWLESRLSAAMTPVTPRAEFVDVAKRALLTSAPVDAGIPARQAMWPVALLLLAAALSFATYKRWRSNGSPRPPA